MEATWHIVRVKADGTEYNPLRIHSGYTNANEAFELLQPIQGERIEFWFSNPYQTNFIASKSA